MALSFKLRASTKRTRRADTHEQGEHSDQQRIVKASQFARLLRSLELLPEVVALKLRIVRELEQTVAQRGLVENKHFCTRPSRLGQVQPGNVGEEEETEDESSKRGVSTRFWRTPAKSEILSGLTVGTHTGAYVPWEYGRL